MCTLLCAEAAPGAVNCINTTNQPSVLSLQGHITERDLWVGARIPVLGRELVLLRADEFTLAHMERGGHEHADPGRAGAQLRTALQGAAM